jgi:hypothetical protein
LGGGADRRQRLIAEASIFSHRFGGHIVMFASTPQKLPARL